jgi:hypothetical protein
VWTFSDWGRLKQLECWSMLLIAIVLFARASCITSFCPLLVDVEVPQASRQWDTDGLPAYIIIGLRRWKSRTQAHWCKCPSDAKCACGKVYKMKVHRNYLDPCFCPVLWFLMWLKYSEIKDGPIFQYIHGGKVTGEALKESNWQTMTQRLFIASGLYFPASESSGVAIPAHGVTNQGIRRSAAQWAGRCGAKMITDLANNGRWKTLETIGVYLGQGAKTRSEKELEHGEDPIFKMWVWKPVTVAGVSTANEL